jgi:hypothetical protein
MIGERRTNVNARSMSGALVSDLSVDRVGAHDVHAFTWIKDGDIWGFRWAGDQSMFPRCARMAHQ